MFFKVNLFLLLVIILFGVYFLFLGIKGDKYTDPSKFHVIAGIILIFTGIVGLTSIF